MKKLMINAGKIITNILVSAALFFLCSCSKEVEITREKTDFNHAWKFELKDSSSYSKVEYNDIHWRSLDLPHDWSIEGTFSKDNPAGIGGGALPGGTGWYRKTFRLPESDSLRRIYITFDGVYHNSEVYLNGQLLGIRPNGYISFQYDLSPYLKFGEAQNVIAVRVDNSDQPNSRWYSGSGIYRNVWLEKMHPVHIDLWGTHITSRSVSEKSAQVELSIIIKNTTGEDKEVKVETQILNENENVIAIQSYNVQVNLKNTYELTQKFLINSPELWSIGKPCIYKAVSTLRLSKDKIDVYETPFGIRSFKFDSQKGFILNGQPIKICGVCNHHDLGALGTAINARAIERQLEILKEMGCNSIRTSHNPPAPELLDLCDRMGFIVIDETFDVWAKKKVDNDYSRCWEEWHIRDLTDHLLRDRNHPSVFSWSIGNEILEQWDSTGIFIAKELAAIVKKYAPEMPVTSGLNDPEPHNYIIKSGVLDLIGFNYHHQTFEQFPEKFNGEIFIATETNSSLSSRGMYDMPSDSIRIWPDRWDVAFYEGNPDNSCSSYDNCMAPWGSTHADTWKLIRKHDFLSGLFIWTGFDYLGEPTPYQWPSRSSYFGLIDLAGFPKDSYFMYQSEWTDKPVLHIFPHWNWIKGQTIDVWAYTNFDEVELFINGKSQGSKSKQGDDLHIQWQVTFEPGSLKAKGKNKTGEIMEVIINTAGSPAKLELIADRDNVKADGTDLAFITVNVLDNENNLVPYADNLIHFEVPDMVSIAGVDNGCQTSHEPFKANYRKAFNGKCLLIVQSKNIEGYPIIKATSEGLKPAIVKLAVK
ncbi:MAG: DUF4982 domain-containing protein [Bacteroidales bacterium]|nr:DUF4982 domain-containing protein [Bacteroidales bacterium]